MLPRRQRGTSGTRSRRWGGCSATELVERAMLLLGVVEWRGVARLDAARPTRRSRQALECRGDARLRGSHDWVRALERQVEEVLHAVEALTDARARRKPLLVGRAASQHVVGSSGRSQKVHKEWPPAQAGSLSTSTSMLPHRLVEAAGTCTCTTSGT